MCENRKNNIRLPTNPKNTDRKSFLIIHTIRTNMADTSREWR